MWRRLRNTVLILLFLTALQEASARGRRRKERIHQGQDDEQDQVRKADREGKLFSIFSIVQFKNSPCRSLITRTALSGANFRNGTCLTTAECAAASGTASGSCAAGFGVCCVFILSSSGGSISQNCSYIQNPGYPATYADVAPLSYTVRKCGDGICYLRLDFDSFTTVGPTDTLETQGGTCTDSFSVSTNTNQNIPTICGQNSGQHIYIDMGDQNTDTATLDFAFTGTSNLRTWDIKVTQVPCKSNYRPPDGCLQYHTGLTGQFSTFNFQATDETHLANQEYSVCIRQEEGYCCVQYMTCPDADDAFTQDTISDGSKTARTDTECTQDYIGISSSSTLCNPTQTLPLMANRYCGPFLNTQAGSDVDFTICDCSAPFQIDVYTDALDDMSMGADPGTNTALSRGTCLTWTQIPC